ncbi:MAG TPA: PilZ domain-containing protein [Bryobacteraceae bacterium]|nr:PilZ domain-containing protein [Bryobacteraceae bacterium]
MESMLADRRTEHRFEMELPVHYRLLRGSRVLYEGSGTTANLSRGGLSLKTERFLPSGLSIQLSVEWPVGQGHDQMLLRLSGRILRCDGEVVAVRTNWHEFVRPNSGAGRASTNEHALVA